MLRYGVDDGLPSGTLYSIFKDTRGFLWFTTDNGIARYNGTRFEKFTTDDGLADNEVFYCTEDMNGRLWMATYNGKLCYYKDGIFHNEKTDSFLRLPFHEPYLLHIDPQADSSVIMVFNDRTKFVCLDHGRFRTYDLGKFKQVRPLYLVHVRKIDAEHFEILYKDQKLMLDTNGNRMSLHPHPGNVFFNPKRDRLNGYLYTNEALYTEQGKKLLELNKSIGQSIIYLVRFVKGNYLIGTDDGLYVNSDRHLLAGTNVTAIVQDEEGNFWVSTLKSGAYYLDKNFLKQRVYKSGDVNDVLFSACRDSVLYFTTAANDLRRLKQDKVEVLLRSSDSVRINAHGVSMGFDIDEHGDYFSYYYKKTTILKNVSSSKTVVVRKPNPFDYGIKALHAVNGRAYILTPTLLSSIGNGDTEGIRGHTIYDLKVNEKPYYMTRAWDNSIWFSKNEHVYKVQAEQSVEQLQFRGMTFKWFSVYDHYLVGGTTDNRLIVCNNPGGKAMCASVANEQCVWGKAYRLDSTHVIVGTNTLYRIITLYPSPDTPRFSISVIENPVVPGNAESICADGTDCYFFKKGTISRFPVSDLLVKPRPPRIFFTGMLAGTQMHALHGARVSLSYRESRSLRLLFTPQTYSGKDLSYEYSVTGEGKWMPIKAQEIDLLGIGYGSYNIQVRARSHESGYSNTASLLLTIQRPWWATWWFRGVGVLLLFGIAYLVVRMVIRRRDREHNVRVGLLRSEYKALNALMNPHLMFNVLNNVQGLIDDGDKLKAKEYLHTFSLLMRQNMQNISRDLIPLQKEIELLTSYLKIEKLRFKELLNYQIEVDEDVDTHDILIPPLLIQPLVENAILHGLLPAQSPDAMVRIRIFLAGDDLVLEITDNGIGFNRSSQKAGRLHESFGLNNVRTRIGHLSAIQAKDIRFTVADLADRNSGVTGTVATIQMQL